MTKKQIKFTEEQLTAIAAIKEYATEMFSPSWYFAFTGPAGSGKTACMMEVQRVMINAGLRIVFTAPTNKAAKVLRGVVGKATTTYKFLNLRVMPSGEIKRVMRGKDPDLSHLDVLVVDEGSMINKELFGYLKEAAEKWGFKVVFMGDPFQLPPVNETESKALTGKLSAALETVMRHDNQILTFATKVREQIGKERPRIELLDDNDDEEGVFVVDQDDFRMLIFNAAKEGHFNDGETSKVVAWRNNTVAYYNNIIRYGIFGKEAKPDYFLIGERVSAGSPCMWGETPLLNTDEGGLIVGIEEKPHPYYNDFKTFELTVETDEIGKKIKLSAIHPDSKEELEDYFNELAATAKRTKRWDQFWEAKEYFHDVRYGYAETAHKSQGSTYRDVYVDSMDIMANKNKEEAYRCFYVASTRPTTRLILL